MLVMWSDSDFKGKVLLSFTYMCRCAFERERDMTISGYNKFLFELYSMIFYEQEHTTFSLTS